MKIVKILTVLWSVFLGGCLAHWKYFVHDETEGVRRFPDDAIFVEGKKYVRDGVLVVPDFSGFFNNSSRLRDGGISFISKNPTVVTILRIEVFNQSSTPLTIPFNKTEQLKKHPGDSRFYFNFSHLNNIDMKLKKPLMERLAQAFNEGGFTMKLYFQVDNGEEQELTFKMRVKNARDIAWGT